MVGHYVVPKKTASLEKVCHYANLMKSILKQVRPKILLTACLCLPDGVT